MSKLDGYINTIINADCMDILKQLPDKCIDLVLTDPPYGMPESLLKVLMDLNIKFRKMGDMNA